uniref:Adenylate and Guanylate cyclase catalytic domain containing protein, putative n=1 Tax=Theileria annulata TaxID=5874 RepID=A0A3B0NBY2_THEAN
MKIFRSCSWFFNQVILNPLKNKSFFNNKYDQLSQSTTDETDTSADDFDSSDEFEEDENEFYERVRNDWEWLSLRYERRLNELLKLIKNNKTNNNINNANITNNVNVNLSPFLSFIPNIMQTFLVNYIDKTINCKSNLSLDGLGTNEEIGQICLDSDFYGNIIELMKNGIFEGDVPIVFCDISGFTNLTQRIENSENPQSVANLGRFLNDFFDPIINLIYHFNGDIIKFSGDAILAIFCGSDKSTLSTNDSLEASSNGTDVDVEQEKDLERCLNSIKCCIELHNILNNYPIHYSNYETTPNSEELADNITIHISCIYGNIKIKLVGGIFERYEYVVIGDVLNELKVLSNLSKSNETVLSPKLYNKVRNYISTQQIIFDNNIYYKLLSLGNDETSDAHTTIDETDDFFDDNFSIVTENSLDTLSSVTVINSFKFSNKFDHNIGPFHFNVDNSLLLRLSEINQKNNNLIIKLLKFFMPRYIYNRLLINHFNICNNEMRKMTIIFINFRINTTNTVISNKLPYNTITDSSNTDKSSMNAQDKVDSTDPNNSVKQSCVDSGVLNEIMLICQKCTYSYEGTINKLIVDDKGISILIFMGFPPLFHEDDAFRSILLSLKVFKMSKKIGFNVGIGICTGKVWCGLLGNKLRNEFTSIGNIVNISNRLMMNSFNIQQLANSDNSQFPQENTDSDKVQNTLFKSGPDFYNILIDENTYNECSSMIELLELEKIKVKGRDEKLAVYTPTGKLKIHNNDDMNTSDNNIVNDTIIKHLYHNTELISVFSTDKENKKLSILEDSEDNHIIVINDETTMNNRLIHKYIDNSTDDDHKVLYVNYDSNRLIYNTLEHTYKLLIHKIISLYNNSKVPRNSFHKFSSNETDDHSSDLNVEETLKMLLNPKFHWYINILNKLIDNRNSDNKLQHLLSSNYNNDHVNAVQLLLNSNKRNLNIGNTKPRDVNLQNIINNEVDNLESYIYSLIKGINLYYNIILIINIVKATSVNDSRDNKVELNNGEQLKGVHIDMARIDKLLKKLIRYNKKQRTNPDKNRFMLVVLNNDQTDYGIKDPVGISSKVIDIKRLKKTELKNVLSNIMNDSFNTTEDSESKGSYDSSHVDVLVDNVYNITNGVHSITYEFIRYLIDNNFNYDKFSNHLYKFFHTTNKSVDDNVDSKSDSVGLEEKQIIRLVHNYYEYKLNVIKSDELFILKILTILNKPIEMNQLAYILSSHKNNISNDDNINSPDEITTPDYDLDNEAQMCKKVDVEEHVNKLLLNNLIESGDEKGVIFVNNKILKGIISNIILPDEKLRIIDNLAVHTY